MREIGLPRDYVFSFIAEPGRTLTPACINEIWSGVIGKDIEPATDAVVRLFVNERINSVRPLDDRRFEEPVSPWRIQQALLWARSGQTSLFREEGYQTEFKILFENGDAKIARYMKTMSAFANQSGGYIFFGLDDAGRPVRFNAERFDQHDWDAFDKLLENRFKPYIRWHRAVADVSQRPEFTFDAELFKREARYRKVPDEYYKWIGEPDPTNSTSRVGVIYTYRSEERVTCRLNVPKVLKVGVAYVRRMARNGQFEDQELELSSVPQQSSPRVDVTRQRLDEFEERLVRAEKPKAAVQDSFLPDDS